MALSDDDLSILKILCNSKEELLLFVILKKKGKKLNGCEYLHKVVGSHDNTILCYVFKKLCEQCKIMTFE